MLNITRRTKHDDIEELRRFQCRHDKLKPADQTHERLVELREFIRLLAKTEHGKRELDCRTRQFGSCEPQAEEAELSYYGRLRRWLDRDIP